MSKHEVHGIGEQLFANLIGIEILDSHQYGLLLGYAKRLCECFEPGILFWSES